MHESTNEVDGRRNNQVSDESKFVFGVMFEIRMYYQIKLIFDAFLT